MEQKYLIDTNCAIDYLNNMLPESGADLIEDTLLQISIISRMELLGWPNAKPGDVLVSLMQKATAVPTSWFAVRENSLV